MSAAKDRLPEEIRDLYGVLWDQLVGVHFAWGVLQDLFTGDPERGRLLEMTAPAFFQFVRQALQDAVIVGVARLSDKPDQGNYRNASLEALVQDACAVDPGLSAGLAQLVQTMVVATRPVHARRSQLVAHLNRDTILSRDSRPLPGVSSAQMEAALAAMREIMNRIELHFADSTTLYEQGVAHGDADALVCHLERSLDAEDDEREAHGLPRLWRRR